MFSKICRSTLLSVLCLTVFSACGVRFSETEKDNSKLDLDTGACLKQAGEDFSLFIKGEAKDVQVEMAVNCISETLRTFATSVNGQNKTYYTAEEIKYFIDKNVFKDGETIDAKFVEQVFEFKTSIIGGTKDRITKAEFKKIADTFDSIAQDLVAVNPNMKIYVGKWDTKGMTFDEKRHKFKIAAIKMNEIATKVFSRFDSGVGEYPVNSFMDLAKSAMAQFNVDQKTIDQIESYRGLAVEIKKKLIGKGDKIKPTDWPQIGYALSKVIEIKMIGTYFNPKESADSAQQLKYLALLIEDIFESVAKAMGDSKVEQLTPADMLDLAKQIFKVVDEKIKVDQNFVSAVTMFKNVLVAPSVTNGNNWTLSDIQQLASKVDFLMNETSIILKTYKEIKDNPKISYADFENKEKVIQQSADHILQYFAGSFDIKNLKFILEQVEKAELLGDSNLLKNFDETYSVIKGASRILTGNSGTLLTSTNLKNIVYSAARLYLHFMEYDYFMKPYSVYSDEFSTAALTLNDKLNVSLKASLQYHPKQGWQAADILKTYSEVVTSGFMKKFITDSSLDIVIKVLLRNVLNKPEDRIAGKALASFNQLAVDRLHFIVNKFFFSQVITARLIKSGETLSLATLKSRITSLLSQYSSNAEATRNLKEFQNVLNVPAGMTFDDKKAMKIANGVAPQYRQYDLNTSTLSRALSWILIQSASKNINNINNLVGLSKPEFQELYDFIRPVILEFDFIAKENTTFVSSRFMEANLFVLHANGDTYANYYEIHDLILHIMSGTQRSNNLIKPMLQACNSKAVSNFDRYTPINATCAINFLYNYKNGFDGLTDYLNFKVQVKKEDVMESYRNIMMATGYVDGAKEAQVQNMQDFPHAIQYVEMMFAKYDTDKSGTLNKDEALKAFPTFKATIQEALAKQDASVKDKELPGVFIYFLKNGRGPKGIIEKLEFKLFIGNENKWKSLNANRLDVAKVFAFLSQ